MNRLTNSPSLLLRIEGAVLLAVSVLFYSRQGSGWLLFGLLLLVPDLSMLGYLAGNRVGAVIYNLFHTYAPPAALALYGLLGGHDLGLSLALIWLAHIGMDRLVGYGLKYPGNFKDTHLQHV